MREVIEYIVGLFLWVTLRLHCLNFTHDLNAGPGSHAQFDVIQKFFDVSSDLPSYERAADDCRGSGSKGNNQHDKDWSTPVSQPFDITAFSDHPAPQNPCGEEKEKEWNEDHGHGSTL